jgi:hypothetical protein
MEERDLVNEVDDKSASEFEKIWWDMEKIEPLTPVTQSRRKD